MPHYEGTRLQSDTCPRRVLIDEGDWMYRAFELHRHTDGKLGTAFDEETPAALDALAAIDEGRAVRQRLEAEARRV